LYGHLEQNWMVRSRYRPFSPFQIGDFSPDSVRASSHKVSIPLNPCCPVYFSGVDFYQVEQALCPSAYIIYYYVIQMPGTLRLILNLFDDLLDNFFFHFFSFQTSSFKFIQNHSSSDRVKKGSRGQRSSKIYITPSNVIIHLRFLSFPRPILIPNLRSGV